MAFAGFILSSCASVFNSKSIQLDVITSEKTTIKTDAVDAIYIDSDTLSEHSLRVQRSNERLNLTLNSIDTSKTVSVSSKISLAYYFNFFPISPYFIHTVVGVLIDNRNPKKYAYPKKIYVDMEDSDNDYLTFKPLDKSLRGYKNVLKINALKMGSFEVGGMEISYERKTSKQLATQLTGTYILPSIWNITNYKPNKLSGFQLGIEERFYWKNTAPIGYYFAAEFNYLNSRSQFTEFFNAHNEYYSIRYQDEFGVRKKTYSWNLKIGQQFFIKRFSIDLSAGAGLRYKRIRHVNLINPEANLDYNSFILPSYKQLNIRPGNRMTVSFPVSVRVGWLF